jgi:hypothetical protein
MPHLVNSHVEFCFKKKPTSIVGIIKCYILFYHWTIAKIFVSFGRPKNELQFELTLSINDHYVSVITLSFHSKYTGVWNYTCCSGAVSNSHISDYQLSNRNSCYPLFLLLVERTRNTTSLRNQYQCQHHL